MPKVYAVRREPASLSATDYEKRGEAGRPDLPPMVASPVGSRSRG
jgi:hypothetical protein